MACPSRIYITSDRATAGTDAHLGMTYTLAYLKIVHGRNGLYNDSRGVYSRVHYGRSYNNAFWSASCKCMTYGDGDGSVFSPLVSLDVAAHEMSHGVCSATANLVYSGESGGLNESNSDIFGAAVEFYAASSKYVGDWWIGEMIYTPATAGDALRYMDTPKRDGRHRSTTTRCTPRRWTCTTRPGSPTTGSTCSPTAAPTKPPGSRSPASASRDAQRIWYVALTGYMTSEVLAKHDENYMPPDVADSLKKAHEEGVARAKARGQDPGSTPMPAKDEVPAAAPATAPAAGGTP